MALEKLRFNLSFLHSQLFVTPPPPSQDWHGRTIIITGANAGLGFQAAKLVAAQQPAKLIIACRSQSKGAFAREALLAAVPACTPTAVEVWLLDLASYESVRAFGARVAQQLPRLDALVAGAGVLGDGSFAKAEHDEAVLTVNVVSTFLLALLLLPKLRATAAAHAVTPTLTVVASEVAHGALFKERDRPQGEIFPALNANTTGPFMERYSVSKLLQVLVVRELAQRLGSVMDTPVVACTVNPGLNQTDLFQTMTKNPVAAFAVRTMLKILARKPAVGARTYINGAEAGRGMHGVYMSDGAAARPPPLVLGAEGEKLQAKVWGELAAKLEDISPGVTAQL